MRKATGLHEFFFLPSVPRCFWDGTGWRLASFRFNTLFFSFFSWHRIATE